MGLLISSRSYWPPRGVLTTIWPDQVQQSFFRYQKNCVVVPTASHFVFFHEISITHALIIITGRFKVPLPTHIKAQYLIFCIELFVFCQEMTFRRVETVN
uniref:Uncharacterized protein n=1 Tax=Fusarium oxysporum (strain Fo5176) TaxID=660025 RepID=A0A0D2XQA0_FUSOF